MRHEITVAIDASPDAVWAVLADVERWPRWTPTMTKITAADADGLRVGSRYRVEQPRSRPTVWQVTECQPDTSFVWSTQILGTRMVAGHWVGSDGHGGSTARLLLEHHGGIAGLLDLFIGRMLTRYTDTEGASLKKHCEAA